MKKIKKAKLNDKQKMFVARYIEHLDPVRAAKEAGYKSQARQWTHRLLHLPAIRAAIDTHLATRAAASEITVEQVLQELSKVAFANLADYIEIGPDGTPRTALVNDREKMFALSEIQVDEYMDGNGEDARPVRKTRIKMADKLAALRDIGKHLGMFAEKKILSGDPENPLTIDLRTTPVIDAALEKMKTGGG